MRLGLPLRNGLAGFGLFELAINLGASAHELGLGAVDHALLTSIEYFALLREDLPADVLMPRQCLLIEGPSTVITLLQPISSASYE